MQIKQLTNRKCEVLLPKIATSGFRHPTRRAFFISNSCQGGIQERNWTWGWVVITKEDKLSDATIRVQTCTSTCSFFFCCLVKVMIIKIYQGTRKKVEETKEETQTVDEKKRKSISFSQLFDSSSPKHKKAESLFSDEPLPLRCSYFRDAWQVSCRVAFFYVLVELQLLNRKQLTEEYFFRSWNFSASLTEIIVIKSDVICHEIRSVILDIVNFLTFDFCWNRSLYFRECWN